MLYTHKLTFDLKEQKPRQRIFISYGSRGTVAVELSIFDGTNVWSIPDGTACVIRYMKANGNGGVYHVMADGSKAWSVEGNRATVMLIEEAMDVPGLVDISVALVNNGRTLCIHGFDLHVDSNLLVPLEETENALEFSNLNEINTALAALQLKTDVDTTLAVAGKPADAAAVGAAVSQLSAGKQDKGANRLAFDLWLESGASDTFEIPAPDQNRNYFGVLRSTNPAWTAVGCFCGSDSARYMFIPIVTNDQITISIDAAAVTIKNESPYTMSFKIRLIDLC